MKLFLNLFFVIFFVTAVSARADQVEDILCNKSSSCKKVCKLQRDASYNDLRPEDQEVMVKCVNDIVAEINAQTPVKN